jgi:peptide/nickel transport system substrate-binding protein
MVATLLVGACGGAAPSTAPATAGSSTTPATAAPSTGGGESAAPSEAPATGQTFDSIKIAGPGPVMTMDVAKATELSSNNTIILSQGVLFRHDTNGVPQPELAESVTTSADGLTNTVKLKPGLVYSDGTPVTANDIKAGVEHQQDGGIGAPFLAGIKEVVVKDDLTADLIMNYPDPDLLLGLTGRSLSINPADKMASDPDYFLHPVSAGPYVVTEFTPNGTMRMEENPNYVFGPMVVKAVELVYVPDLTSKVLQLATGELDFVWDIPIAAKDSFPPEVTLFTVQVGGANTLYLNMNPEGKAGTKFADPRVRQAMSLAIDRQRIADVAFMGLVNPLTSFWYKCPDICPDGMLPNGGVQDVEAAKALMAEAGVGPEGISAEMLVSSTRGGWKEAAQLVAEDLAQIGVNFTVAPVDEATWNGAVANDNFEAVLNGGSSGPQITMASWFGDGYSATHSGYTTVPEHPQVVELINQMAQELDVAKRKELMTQIQSIGTTTMPMISLVDRIALDGTRLPVGTIGVTNGASGYLIFQTAAQQAAGVAAGEGIVEP